MEKACECAVLCSVEEKAFGNQVKTPFYRQRTSLARVSQAQTPENMQYAPEPGRTTEGSRRSKEEPALRRQCGGLNGGRSTPCELFFMVVINIG